MKTKEELLNPRVKCIGDGEKHYPGSGFAIGQILNYYERGDINLYYGGEYSDAVKAREVLACPHLFKPLKWYEEIKLEDLPLYVKSDYENGSMKKGSIHLVREWISYTEYLNHNNCPFYCYIDGFENKISAKNCIPATEQEYNDYITH